MMDKITFDKLGIPQKWFEPLNHTFALFAINTPQRQAAFLGQCSHESMGFTRLEENLNYSAVRLTQVFPKYFNDLTAAQYAHKPEAIANKVYANRMGNGDEASGDGWKYRGRGLIQCTGRNNYTAASKSTSVPFVENPDLASAIDGGLTITAWFWEANKLNALADHEDWAQMTRKINGGSIGIYDRVARINKFLTILKS